jgi:hypothetical protein
MPLRLVYRAERPIDRSSRRGFVEAAEFSVISVEMRRLSPDASPFDFKFGWGIRARAPAPHTTCHTKQKARAGCLRLFFSLYLGYQIQRGKWAMVSNFIFCLQ